MSVYLSVALRRQLEAADDHCCDYCQTGQFNSGQRMVPDHVVPESKGGITEYENLCFACRLCNEFKGSRVTGIDPATGQTVSLYHPRQQAWAEHFVWEDSGTRILGITAVA